MNKRWFIVVFVLIAIVHVAAPVTMIVRREIILRTGRAYKFRTRPVDPYDAFRGRYVQLAFEQDRVLWRSHDEWQSGRDMFACVTEDTNGFAVIREVALTPPEQGDYLKVEAGYQGWGTNETSVYFKLPFDRYYLGETKAPQAEKTYWEHNRRNATNGNTYAVVRIKDGDAALADLYIADKPIRDYFTNRKPYRMVNAGWLEMRNRAS